MAAMDSQLTGNRALSNCSVSEVAKVIVIRRLRTPATAKAFSYFLQPLFWIKYPGT